MDIGDVVELQIPDGAHEVKYVGKEGHVVDILGTSTGDDGKQEQIVVVCVMGIEEVFMEKQLKRVLKPNRLRKRRKKQH